MKKLIILDGYSFLFRYFYAIPANSRYMTSDNVHYNAIFGCARHFVKLCNQNIGNGIICALDGGGKNVRNAIDSEYKSNRVDTPDKLMPQFDMFDGMLDSMNIATCRIEGYEADDIIASYVSKLKGSGTKIDIYTSDKDLMQLVNEDVRVFNLVTKSFFGHKEVVEKYGVTPSQIKEYLAMVGDAVDNVKGINGIGKTRAVSLLKEYGSIENIYNNIEAVKAKIVKKSLSEGREQLDISLKLVALYDDIDNIPDISGLLASRLNHEKMQSFIEQNKITADIFGINKLSAAGLKQDKENTDVSLKVKISEQMDLFD